MTHWMCSSCGYYLKTGEPPNQCPGCKQYCSFNDVTCYRPGCGGEANVDPLLVGAALGTFSRTRHKKPEVKEQLTNLETFTQGLGTFARPEHKEPEVKEHLAYLETFTQGQIMAGLTDAQRQQVVSLGWHETYREGDVICTAGTESKKIYFIEEGEVMVEIEYGKGMFVPISVVGPNEAFGWTAVVPPYKHSSTVVALAKTRMNAIDGDSLRSLIRNNPAMGVILMENVASMIASRQERLKLELVELLRGSQSPPDVLHVKL
jgi:CRP-like cAMP-binding protein